MAEKGFIEPYEEKDKIATAVAEALELFFDWLHTPLEVTSTEESTHWGDMYDAMNKARELVLADNEVSDE